MEIFWSIQSKHANIINFQTLLMTKKHTHNYNTNIFIALLKILNQDDTIFKNNYYCCK